MAELKKQSELNKLLNATIRDIGKLHGWRFSRGFAFQKTELLFFSIIILGRARRRDLFYALRYKLLAFDDLFWRIVRLEENLKQPLSFRAAGAWTAPSTPLLEDRLSIADWDAKSLKSALNEIFVRSDSHAGQIAKDIQTPGDNLRLIERSYARLKNDHPNAVTNIWVERILTAILKNEYQLAEKIIRDRMDHRDAGGFQIGNRSFYELANEYLSTTVGL